MDLVCLNFRANLKNGSIFIESFNFFIFSIVISGVYKILGLLFLDVNITAKTFALFDISLWPMWIQLLIFFIILDFVQWFTHVLLHKYPFLWQFHKVHHSVKEMGFAAHLRYHWMENILYKPLKTFGVMIIGGFEPEQAYIVHFITIAIGHLNHANLGWDYGILKYVFNNPKMHIWHHAKELPARVKYGVNFGLSLSIWDYLFGTAHVPYDGRDIELGFEGDEHFPQDFLGQEGYPLTRK